jgi:hypothetical protein
VTAHRALPVLAAGLVLTGLLGGCGSGDGGEGDGDSAAERASESATMQGADQTVCRADARPAADAVGDLPSGWSFPPATTAYDVERRDGVGTIVTAVTATPFARVLDHLNHAERGVRITSGETEEDDAEASWTADGHTGRWAIRTSATCPGETVIQVLSSPAG